MIDLHAHTSISDGTVSPRELIKMAKDIGLSAIAITDHDSIDGHLEAQDEANKLGITLVKGIEFSVTYGVNRFIHILGLGIDAKCKGFMDIYREYRQVRSSKLNHVFLELQDMGVMITRADVEPFVIGEYMDRQAIAKWLVNSGYASIIKKSWVDYLDKIPYITGELITPKDAFDAIHAGGGKAFMAHYHLHIGLKGYTDEEARFHLQKLKKVGLDGIEYYYPSFTKDDSTRCGKYIEDYDFMKCGGTDYHGENRPHIKLGVGEGTFKVPEEILENILSSKNVD